MSRDFDRAQAQYENKMPKEPVICPICQKPVYGVGKYHFDCLKNELEEIDETHRGKH